MNDFQSFLRHIKFMEDREGWSPSTDEEIKVAYERVSMRAVLKGERLRRQVCRSEEEGQGLKERVAFLEGCLKERKIIHHFHQHIPEARDSHISKPKLDTSSYQGSIPLL